MPVVTFRDSFGAETTLGAFSTVVGTPGVAQEVYAWVDYGLGAGTGAPDMRLAIAVQDPMDSTHYFTSSQPALDHRWFQVKITGSSNPGFDPLFDPPSITDWIDIGTYMMMSFGDVRSNCAVIFQVRCDPPGQGGSFGGVPTIKLFPVFNERLIPLPEGITLAGGGTLTGIGDTAAREWDVAPIWTPTGSPDNVVHATRSKWTWDGTPRAKIKEDVTVTAVDGNGATLASGEEYKILLYQGPGVGAYVQLKGAKAVAGSAIAPVPGIDQMRAALVTRPFSGVIGTGQITNVPPDRRHRVKAVTGLQVGIVPGKTILLGSVLQTTATVLLTLADNTTSYVWATTSGDFTATVTSTKPSYGARLLATVVTASGAVTTVNDKRAMLEPGMVPITLRSTGTLTTGANKATAVVPFRWGLDRVQVTLKTASIGATGATICDVNKNGTTIFTSQGGTPENRPSIAAQSLADTAFGGYSGLPQVTTGEAGDTVSLDIDAITAGGTTEVDLNVTLFVYPICEV